LVPAPPGYEKEKRLGETNSCSLLFVKPLAGSLLWPHCI
jgi:hypothetical protein